MLDSHGVEHRGETFESKRPQCRLLGILAIEHERDERGLVRMRDVHSFLIVNDGTESDRIGSPSLRHTPKCLPECENAHKYLYALGGRKLA